MNTQLHPQGTELQYWKDRTAYLEAENDQLRAENASMIAQIKDQEAQIEALKARVLKLTQQVYGRKSEQQATKDKNSSDSSPVRSGRRRGQQQGSKGHGRRKYHNLPAREEI